MAPVRRADAQQQPAAHRLGRGVAAGALGTVGTTLAHHAGGAEVPSALAIGTTLVATTLVATGLAGRRLGMARILALAGAAQVCFHLVFSTLSAQAVTASAPSEHHHAMLSPGWATVAGTGATSGWHPMLWTHLLATVLIAALVANGEAAASRSLSGLLGWVCRATTVLCDPPHREPARVSAAGRGGAARLWSVQLAVAPARGPPLALA